jgi:hypothetical protein
MIINYDDDDDDDDDDGKINGDGAAHNTAERRSKYTPMYRTSVCMCAAFATSFIFVFNSIEMMMMMKKKTKK